MDALVEQLDGEVATLPGDLLVLAAVLRGLVGHLGGRLGQIEAAEDGVVALRMNNAVLEHHQSSS